MKQTDPYRATAMTMTLCIDTPNRMPGVRPTHETELLQVTTRPQRPSNMPESLLRKRFFAIVADEDGTLHVHVHEGSVVVHLRNAGTEDTVRSER